MYFSKLNLTSNGTWAHSHATLIPFELRGQIKRNTLHDQCFVSRGPMLHDGDDERNSVPRTRPARCQYCSALDLLGPHRVSVGIVFAFAHIGYSEAKAGPKSARPRLTSIARIDRRCAGF